MSKSRPYTIVYNDIIDHQKLTFGEKLVFIYMLKFKKSKYFSMVRISEDLGASEKTIRKHIDLLVANNIVARTRRFNQTNLYYIRPENEWFKSDEELFFQQAFGEIEIIEDENDAAQCGKIYRNKGDSNTVKSTDQSGKIYRSDRSNLPTKNKSKSKSIKLKEGFVKSDAQGGDGASCPERASTTPQRNEGWKNKNEARGRKVETYEQTQLRQAEANAEFYAKGGYGNDEDVRKVSELIADTLSKL